MAVEQTLSHEQARRFYDEFGSRQDLQGWYEDPANAALIARARFEEATSVLEFGCGTGRLAAALLEKRLPKDCRYLGLDASGTMHRLAHARLRPWEPRAEVRQTDGGMSLAIPSQSIDRVLTTYVLDLLSLQDIAAFLDEAHRVLTSTGLLCAVGLTPGERGIARSVTRFWRYLHSKNPLRVGGCRPLQLMQCLPAERWRVLHREVIVAWGLASEAVIASPLK